MSQMDQRQQAIADLRAGRDTVIARLIAETDAVLSQLEGQQARQLPASSMELVKIGMANIPLPFDPPHGRVIDASAGDSVKAAAK